ncbi:MAG: LON peptidase substrate-binding domain-containing protein [Thermoanaerobaculia bacterium]
MRRELPIFPLPDLVFFPETTLPLQIFEPRYRAMLEDAMEGDRTIGIQTLSAPGAVTDVIGDPAVLAVGCAGEIVEHEPQDDGRSHIVLTGLYRYRIVSEVASGRPYRIARVDEYPIAPLSPSRSSPQSKTFRTLLTEVVNRLATSVGRVEAGELPLELSDEGLVNEAVSRLGLDTDDRYRLLTMERLEERYRWVLEHVAGVQRRLDLLAPFRRARTEARWN